MKQVNPYEEFTARLKLLISSDPDLITMTLSNIFTMRLIGNKTHGDLAEIAISEFINQYMYDYQAEHVGKDLFRAKSKEEDIKITNALTKASFPVSLKAYGDGPLQLSTDKSAGMFGRLMQENAELIDNKNTISAIFGSAEFSDFSAINIMSLIYDKKKPVCNILVFDYNLAQKSTAKIAHISEGGKRIHPIFQFFDAEDNYIFEVRYGDATANALQRGLWTNTKRALQYFDSVTNGWIDYAHNFILVKLFSHALVSSYLGHEKALAVLKDDIARIIRESKPS